MALASEVYRAFEDVVGTENISEDPAILDSYAWRSGLSSGPDDFVPRFEAVILPRSTEEAQAIVRLCNRHRIPFKASSTGWAFFNDPPAPGVIKIDLRRMNHILEINEKSMYAVVEPYVIFAQLQAELMKKGLNCNITGAGSQCSALPLAAHENIGHMGQSTSYGERNQLALEWVTPEGEIIRFGSLASVGEWFCGDGPGPSLRGIIRGCITPLGGLGIFTRAAVKVYHWPGPPVFPIEGTSPHYYPGQIPDGFMVRYFSFPSLDKRFEAIRKIGESEISFELMAFAPSMIAANLATSNEEDMENLKILRGLVQGPGFLVIIVGNSPNDFEYKRKVLQKIIEETSGESLKLVEDPKIGGALLWRCIRITGSIRETLRATGTFGGVVGGTDTTSLMTSFVQNTLKLKEDLIKKGLVYDDGAESFAQSFEHGHYGHAELLIRYKLSPESALAMFEFMKTTSQIALSKSFGVPHQTLGDGAHDMFGPRTSHYNHWLRGIKKTFDPNGVSDATNYISAKE